MNFLGLPNSPYYIYVVFHLLCKPKIKFPYVWIFFKHYFVHTISYMFSYLRTVLGLFRKAHRKWFRNDQNQFEHINHITKYPLYFYFIASNKKILSIS